MKRKYILTKAAVFVTALSLLSFLVSHNSSKTNTAINVPPAVSTSSNNLGDSVQDKTLDISTTSSPEPTTTITPVIEKPIINDITLSFVGDCTLGTDPEDFAYTNSLPYVLDKNNNDYSYFFKGVYPILSQDDLTIANLETTLTTSKNYAIKTFTFRGDPSYVNILLQGSVETVNLANNHTYDYKTQGYEDTIKNLSDAGVSYYGNNAFCIKEVDGIKIGFAGFAGWNNDKSTRTQIKEAMDYFTEQGADLKIVTFHWGVERQYSFNATQQALGHYAIDCGANLVVGHHPHVLQGIEEYNGSYIVYSLGNFVFGGNSNPSDKDTMIFKQTFTFTDNKLTDNSINIIPASLSSKTNINDYQPQILTGSEEDRVLNKVLKYSKNFSYQK